MWLGSIAAGYNFCCYRVVVPGRSFGVTEFWSLTLLNLNPRWFVDGCDGRGTPMQFGLAVYLVGETAGNHAYVWTYISATTQNHAGTGDQWGLVTADARCQSRGHGSPVAPSRTNIKTQFDTRLQLICIMTASNRLPSVEGTGM